MKSFFLRLLRRRRLEHDLETELAFHREMAAAQGNPIPLGNTTVIKEQAFDLWRFNWVENLWRDIVYAVRALRQSPGFVLSALLSLGLGIGVNTAMFSLAVEFLLSEPSVTDASSLVAINVGGNSHAERNVIEALEESGAFQSVTGENEEAYVNWNDGQETRPVFAVQTAKNFFAILGVPMSLGRGWTVSDPDEVVVIRWKFWHKHFNSDPSLIGKAIQLGGKPFTVVGILPENHRTLIGYGFSPDMYVPVTDRKMPLAVYARLKPGVKLGEARAAVHTIAERLDQGSSKPWKYASQLRVAPVGGFARLIQDGLTMTVGIFFAILLVLVGMVLLIACVNVAGLLLARSSARQQEIAIRLSLGASSGRLFQQLLSESMVLSVAGTVAGFGLAVAVTRLLAAVPLPLPFPIELHIEPDWRVVTYAAMLAVFATLASGLTPAWQTVRDSLVVGLNRERKLRLRRGLVVAQIAISCIVLAAGALFLQNLIHSSAMGPGFDLTRTVRAEVHLPVDTYRDKSRKNQFVDQALRRLAGLPGIEAVAAARIIPFTDSTRFGSELIFEDTGEKVHAGFQWNAVSPDFFRAMEIPILSGRPFEERDRSGPRVVIVNTTFVKRYLGRRNPIGTLFAWGEGHQVYEIAGVAAPTKNMTIGENDIGQLYQPFAQIENDRTKLQFVLRSAAPPATQLAAVRQALREVEPAAGLEVTTLFSSIGLAFFPSQVGAALMGSIGLLGLLLAAIGLYGVLAYSVARRTREIGIRVAIGASGLDISRMILGESLRLVIMGSSTGLLIGLLVTRPLAIFLVPGLSPSDPMSFTAVVLGLAVTCCLASLGPARRALAIEPMSCLRHQ